MLDGFVKQRPKRSSIRRGRRIVRMRYAGARLDDHRRKWRPGNRHPDREIGPDIGELRARSRALVRDTPLGAAHPRTLEDYVVGDGIRPQPTATLANGKPAKTFNAAVAELWERMEDVFDARRMQSIYDIQALALRSMTEAGACLIHMPVFTRDPDLPVPLQIYGIEPDFLSGDGENKDTGNEIRSGVELDRTTGRPVAFHIQVERKTYATGKVRRIPAEEMVYLFTLERWGQVLGAPAFSPVLGQMHDQAEYEQSELTRADWSARSTHYVKTPYAKERMAQWGKRDETDDDDEESYTEEIERGTRTFLFDGEEPIELGKNVPPGNYEPFIVQGGRKIAVGLGLSYELLTGDHTNTHFSASRAVWVRDQRRIGKIQAFLVWHFCRRVYGRMIDLGVSARALPVEPARYFGDARVRHRLRKAQWLPPGIAWHEPLKDIAGALMEIAAGISTRSEVCARHNKVFERVIDRLAEEEAYIASKGLKAISVPGDLKMLMQLIDDDEGGGKDDGQDGRTGRNGKASEGMNRLRELVR